MCLTYQSTLELNPIPAKVTNQALLISDMPYQSYTSAKQTLENAKYLMLNPLA
jgi:ketopantoate hydroxymethyltransferase